MVDIQIRCKENNAGWRIDYFFATDDMFKNNQITEAFIDNDLHGSDHCPVGLVIDIDYQGQQDFTVYIK